MEVSTQQKSTRPLRGPDLPALTYYTVWTILYIVPDKSGVKLLERHNKKVRGLNIWLYSLTIIYQ